MTLEPTLRDRLAKIVYEAERGLGVFYEVLWEDAYTSDRRRAYRIVDALLTSEEWQDLEQVAMFAANVSKRVTARAFDFAERDNARLGEALARLAATRGTP